MKETSKFTKIKSFVKNLGTDKFSKVRRIVHFSFLILSMVALFLTLFMPIITVTVDGVEYNVIPVGAFSAGQVDAVTEILRFSTFIAILAALAFNAWLLIGALISIKYEDIILKKTRKAMLFDVAFIVCFTLFSYILSPINTALGGTSQSNVNFLALIIIAVLTVLHSVFIGVLDYSAGDLQGKKLDNEARKKSEKLRGKLRIVRSELIVYTLVSAVIALIALLSNIITVEFDSTYVTVENITLTGFRLLSDIGVIEDTGRQLLAYLIFIMLVVIASVVFLSVVSYFSGSKLFGRISVISISLTTAVTLLVGLFSKYYEIVQDMNEGIIVDMIEEYVSAENVLEWHVSSLSLLYFIFSLVVVTVVFIRRPYTKSMLLEEEIEREANAPTLKIETADNRKVEKSLPRSEQKAPEGSSDEAFEISDFDPCPAFTVLDKKSNEYQNLLQAKREALFEKPTLPRLVDFIVEYARDSRLHLFYTKESIATFLAGLGTTKLTILQGMSGTGKTSLPKIVAEALMSVCDIVEVESSWRDKNELLGYYNEFSKTYTPKKFTQALYKAALNSEVLTFIVLDEMNLSRIEYYFSDFLSIMENEPDKREIKLLNVPLYRKDNNSEIEYNALEDGFTLKIPSNVWFIGTANRDESTYDISDKVYDRAHTMNFDKRAKSASSYGEPSSAKYLPISELQRLFDEAKAGVDFRLDNEPIIAEVERLLAPYNISFGNRIANQIENFVKIYASCFSANDFVIRDALEVILLSKVVRKLELKSLDDQEGLAQAFAKLKLLRCSEFINNLKET